MNPKADKNNMSTGILVVAIFCVLSAGYALAEQPPGITLPSVEYKSDGLRDPFEGVFKTEPTATPGPVEAAAKPPLPPPPLTVQGIIWGGNIPQAIINDKVVKVGDTIAEAKITDIGKEGIEVIFKDYTFKLNSPAAVQLENLKPKPEGGQNEE